MPLGVTGGCHLGLGFSFVRLVETVGESSSGRLVDDAHDLKARNGTGVLGGGTLGVAEVGRHSDDSTVNLSSTRESAVRRVGVGGAGGNADALR